MEPSRRRHARIGMNDVRNISGTAVWMACVHIIELNHLSSCNSIVIPTLHQKFSLSNNANDKGTVIRRNNCILLLSRTRTKAMVLQFSSLQHCLDFSDRFVKLNPPIDEFVCPSQTDSGSFFGQLAHRESILAHVVRLLHDPDFESFVSNIEATLSGSTDGTQMLHSWVDRDLSQAENGTQL